MAIADPKNAKVSVPDPFLIAIGKVCVQWGTLESVVELCITKLSGMDINDPRSKVMINHASWPQRVDILATFIDILKSENARLNDWPTIAPLVKKAQDGRNRIIHGFYGVEEGKVKMMKITSRGKLKMSLDEITVSEINAVVYDIHVAAAALMNLVLLTGRDD